MSKASGAQLLVECLAQEGIEMVFGIPGLHNMPIYDALYRHPTIQNVVVRHEQGAAFMADGYARASGRIAAVMPLPGPGVTNAYTGLAEAYSDSSPVLLLATQVNRDDIDQRRGKLHELTGQFEIVEPITKFSARVTSAQAIPELVHRAAHKLRNGRPRPVQLEIPRDVERTPERQGLLLGVRRPEADLADRIPGPVCLLAKLPKLLRLHGKRRVHAAVRAPEVEVLFHHRGAKGSGRDGHAAPAGVIGQSHLALKHFPHSRNRRDIRILR